MVLLLLFWCFLGGLEVRIHLPSRGHRLDPWVRKMPWRRKWQPTPVFLPGKCHGERSLAGYSPWSHKELDMTEHAFKLGVIRRAKTLLKNLTPPFWERD